MDPRLCAQIAQEPALPKTATIVQPVTPAEANATQDFLNWVQGLLDWGRQNQARAELATQSCPK